MAPPPAPTAAAAAADAAVDNSPNDEATVSEPSHDRAVTALEHPLPHHHRPEHNSPATMSASFSLNPNRPLVTPQNRRQPFEELGYELRETLGEGEFGKVKLAIHKATGNKVAIKVFKRARLDDTEKQNKLRREIAILSAVIHKSIVRLFEVLETDELVGLVIEYASGGELFDYILNNKYLSEDEAGRLFAQLIDGVHYLHQKCVVHRDLKLENLLLSESKNLVIIDFGFANQFPDPSTLATPAPNAPFSDPLRAQSIPDRHFLMATSCGSPCYAAPELVVADGYVGTCADVWSCGVILFAMLAGYLPFDDDPENPHGDNITLLYKYILSEPTPLHMPPHLSAGAQDLLRRMLMPDPDRRATMKEVMEHKWLAAYRHFFTKDFSKPPPVPQKDPHRSKSSSRRSKSRSRAPAESVATTIEPSSNTQMPAVPAPLSQVDPVMSSVALLTALPSSPETEDAMDVDVRKSPVLLEPTPVYDDMQVDPAIAALIAPSAPAAAVAPAVEPSSATSESFNSTTEEAVTASTGAANRRMSVDNSQLATAPVSFPALSGNDATTATTSGEITTSTNVSANSYKRNTFSGPATSATKSSPKQNGGGFLDDIKHSIAKLKWRTSRSNKRGTGSASSSTHVTSPAAPEPVQVQIVPATATPSASSSPPTNLAPSPIPAPAPLLAPPAPGQQPSLTAVSRALATSPSPEVTTTPAPPPPPKHPRTPNNRASVLATLTRGRTGNQDVVFTRTDISQDTVHQVFDPATQIAPRATPATGSRQRSKSVGSRSMVVSIRSLVDGGASTAVYERTDVPPVPDLPESLPTAPVGPYQSVYGGANSMGDAGHMGAGGERGRSVTKRDAGVSVKRGRSLTDKLLGRNKRPAEVPPPLPTGFFNNLTPAVVSVDEARQFPAEALTTRTPEVALFEVRKVLEGLGAVVVGHGTDPVRGIPGHGDGPFLLKCRLKLGKKGSGVTPARLKAELDALSLLDNDEDYAPVALPSVDSDSGSRPPSAHRRRKSTATSGGTSTSDALSVYSGYSVSAHSTSGGSTGGNAQVLPEDYPALYTQPDVAAAIAAGRTGPVSRSATPVIPAGTLHSATGAATTSNATAVAYEQTMLASSANAAEASNGMYLNKSVSVHYSSYYSSTPTMSGNARAINEGVHVGSVAKGQVPAENKGAIQVIRRGIMSFGTDLLFTVEVVGLPEHKSTWAIKFHRTKGSSVSYGRVKQIVLRKLYRSDDKLRQLLG